MIKTLVLLYVISKSVFANYEGKINLGERLFSDPRFSKIFKDNSTTVNDNIAMGVSCLSCHKVDNQFDPSTGFGMRTYNDHTALTEVPLRHEDNITHTLRNTPGLVGIGSPYSTQRFSHWDGEFADHKETVFGNFTGRNMGWLKIEKAEALKNIIDVLRNDDGLSGLGPEFGGSYQSVFLGIDPALPERLRLKEMDRIDIIKASEMDIINKVREFVSAYMNDLDFEKDENGNYIGSAYDQFLILNNLPSAPKNNQTINNYMTELRQGFKKLQNPKFVVKRYFPTHGKDFSFGPQEFEGLKVFFNLRKSDGSLNQGMCLSCHKPPLFTDENFHNTGVTQINYDRVHGAGSFKKLSIPKTNDNQNFLSPLNSNDRQFADLGAWNFYGKNLALTDYMNGQLCLHPKKCSVEEILPLMVARFKTPTLRNLGHSGPYSHDGSSPDLYHLLHQYKLASELKRAGDLRNGDNQLQVMQLSHQEISLLVPFLNSLNEDYE